MNILIYTIKYYSAVRKEYHGIWHITRMELEDSTPNKVVSKGYLKDYNQKVGY